VKNQESRTRKKRKDFRSEKYEVRSGKGKQEPRDNKPRKREETRF
jgi:hypothetical protein